MKILWERTVSAEFRGKFTFPQTFYTRKLVQTSVFYGVAVIVVIACVMSEIQSLICQLSTTKLVIIRQNVIKICTKRASSFLDCENNKLVFNAVKKFYFSYCPWIWMFSSITSSNLINRIHGRFLRTVYSDTEKTF